MAADQRYVEYLTQNGYHPRSSKHGDVISGFLISDLMAECRIFQEMATSGKIVYEVNKPPSRDVPLGWNIDLVVGPPMDQTTSRLMQIDNILNSITSDIWLAVDAKSIMTEHGKARRNRQRDLNALASILHMRSSRTIVGGLVVINMAGRFRSPLRGGEVTVHHNIERLTAETVKLFEDLITSQKNGQTGIEAVGVIVVDFENMPNEVARIVKEPPAPQVGSPVHYQSFLDRICSRFNERFG